jgi:hypothetical protein
MRNSQALNAADLETLDPETGAPPSWPRNPTFSDANMFRLLDLMADLTSRLVALENLSLHVFADDIFKRPQPLAEIDSIRQRIYFGESIGSSVDGLQALHVHYDRMLALLEGLAFTKAA